MSDQLPDNLNADELEGFFVTLNLAGEEYGLPIARIQEVIQLGNIIPVPKAPPYLAGVMNMRETIIPMIDLSIRFQIESKVPLKDRRAVVVRHNGKPIGLIVDKINKVIQLKDDIEPAPPTIKGIHTSNITGIGKLENRFIILLNLDTILAQGDALAALAGPAGQHAKPTINITPKPAGENAAES